MNDDELRAIADSISWADSAQRGLILALLRAVESETRTRCLSAVFEGARVVQEEIAKLRRESKSP